MAKAKLQQQSRGGVERCAVALRVMVAATLRCGAKRQARARRGKSANVGSRKPFVALPQLRQRCAFHALLALVLLTAWRKPLPIGAFGAGLLFLLTAKLAWTEIRFYKRPGPMTAFLALCWALSIGSAIFADHYGLL